MAAIEVAVTAKRARAQLKLASEILTYFLRNPQSCDDLEGVARWRLPEERIHETVTATLDALEWLVHKGFLVKEFKQWHGSIYRLNADMEATASSFLASIDRDIGQETDSDDVEPKT